MKKNKIKITALLLSLVCFNALPNAFAADNLITNGDFSEKGDADRVAKDWKSTSWWQWQWMENVGRDNSAGMHLTSTKTGWQTLEKEVAVERNTDYTISYYYKQPDPGHTFQVKGLTTGTSIISEQWMRNVLSDWTRVEYTFNSGENDSIKITFKQMCDVGGDMSAVDAYVDDVELYARRPEITGISVSGYASVGESLTVYTKTFDFFGDEIKEPQYQWQVSENGEDWTDVEGATEKIYEITESDIGLYLRVKAIPVSESKDGTVRNGKEAFSKMLKACEMTAHFPVDISSYFNEKAIATADELNGTVVLDKVGVENAVNENNVILHNEIPYIFELNSENNGIRTKADEDLIIELGNEYLSSLNFAFSYSEIPQDEQIAVIKYNDGTTQEIVYTPGNIFEKSEGAVNSNAFGMYMEDGTKAEDNGYIYSAEFEMEKVAAIESVTFPCAKTGDKLTIYALSGTRVDKNIIKEKIEEEILAIPENIKPTDFVKLDNIEESAKTYELLGGNTADISGFDLEKFAGLRVTGVLNAYNDGDSELIFDAGNGFLYGDLLELDGLDKDGVTIYSLYTELLSNDGKKAVQNELLKKDFESVSELHEKLLQEIVLKAVQYPNVGGVEYIADILTEENIERVEMSAEKYLNAANKSAIHKKIARQEYGSLEELEKDLVPVSTKSPSKGNGGGGGSIGTIPTVTQKTAEEENTNTNPENTQNVQDIQNNPTDLVMFKDVTDEHWAYKPIYRLKDLEIVSGKSKEYFDPNGYVKREEFVKMLCLAFDIERDSNVAAEFSDVDKNAWYENYINTAYSKGIVTGINENTFGIGAELTRQDLCVMAVRVKGVEESTGEELDFADTDSISEYAKDAVSYLVKNGVVNGFEDGSFKPQEKCTRAQAAKIIYELMEIWRDE